MVLLVREIELELIWHLNHFMTKFKKFLDRNQSTLLFVICILYLRRREQVHIMCSMEELIPSIGTSVPSPLLLALVISQSDSTLQNVSKLYSDVPHSPFPDMDFDNPFDFCDEPLLVSKTHLISISDDGKIWDWLLTAEGAEENPKDDTNLDISEVPVPGTNTNILVSATGGLDMEASKQTGRSRPSNSAVSHTDISLKVGF